MDQTEDQLVSGALAIVEDMIFAQLSPADLRHLADLHERDPEAFRLGMRGVLLSLIDEASGPETAPPAK